MKFFQSILTNYAAMLFSVMVCAIISGCASTPTISQDQIAAYKATISDRSDDARNILERSKNNAFSKFLLSCIELSDGNFLGARRYADEFIDIQPNIPDGKVLIELIEERKTYPTEPWAVSFASAWKASGKPKLTMVDFLLNEGLGYVRESCENRKLPEAVIGTSNELLAATENGLSCDKKKFTELCLAHSSPESPAAIKLIALNGLYDVNLEPWTCEGAILPEDLVKRAQERRHELVQQLRVELPQDVKFAVMAILDETSKQDKFSSEDIEKLERAVSRPRLEPLPSELFSDYFNRFVALRSWNPYGSAAGASFSVDTNSYLFALKRKTHATAENAPPEMRERLAIILEKVGRAQVKQRTCMHLLLSLNLLYGASELRGDAISQERYAAISKFARELIVQPFAAVMSSVIWPIRPLMINSIELNIKDEIAFRQLFVDITAPPEYLNLVDDSK